MFHFFGGQTEECSMIVLINVISLLTIYDYAVPTPVHFFLLLGTFSPAQLKVSAGWALFR